MFITFEGPEGSGKTSQIEMLAEALRVRDYSVLTTREPGGTQLGDEVRDVVHHVRHQNMSPVAEMLLYSASRAQHVAQVIRPALAAGRVVLCDRFADSTLAYQGYGRQLDLDALYTVTRIATGGLQPDLTLLLDLDVEVGLARRTAGGLEMNRLDWRRLLSTKGCAPVTCSCCAPIRSAGCASMRLCRRRRCRRPCSTLFSSV
jgi:dTMP kinase